VDLCRRRVAIQLTDGDTVPGGRPLVTLPSASRAERRRVRRKAVVGGGGDIVRRRRRQGVGRALQGRPACASAGFSCAAGPRFAERPPSATRHVRALKGKGGVPSSTAVTPGPASASSVCAPSLVSLGEPSLPFA